MDLLLAASGSPLTPFDHQLLRDGISLNTAVFYQWRRPPDRADEVVVRGNGGAHTGD